MPNTSRNASEVTLVLNADEVETLKAAVLAYAKSKEVTIENFDLVRDLYGKIAPAWNRRKPTATILEDPVARAVAESAKIKA